MLDRSTLANWVHYMAHNPQYFAYVFRVPLTEANLEAAAVQIFGNSHVLWEPTIRVNKYRHKPQRAPMFHGVKAIAEYLTMSVSQVYFLSAHGSLPTFTEQGRMVAYVGMIKRWARNRRINNGNV